MTRMSEDDLRSLVAAMAPTVPARLGPFLDTLVDVRAEHRMDATDVVGALRICTELLPGARTDGMDRVVDDLEEALGTSADDGELGHCGFVPALLALASHLTGSTPHHRPDALDATPMTTAMATEVLGWARSGSPIHRLVAALTASDPALVTPLVDDTHRIVRIAAAANRCLRPSGRPPVPSAEPRDERHDAPVHGRPAFDLLLTELEEAGLAVPELGRRFAEASLLVRLAPWRTATAAWPLPFVDYMFTEAARMLLGPVPQQLAITHAGHGINSYALNLRVAVGPVAVMGQVGWGGVYGGSDDDERWRVLVEGVDLLTHGIALTGHGRLEQRRWLVLHSDLRLGPMPTLLRFDGARWVLPDDVLEQPEASPDHEPSERPSIEELEDRWTEIHNVVEQDLLTFERDWTESQERHGGRLVISAPDDPDGDELRAILDVDGRVMRIEYESDEGRLVRRGGTWIRAEDLPDDWLVDVGRLVHVTRARVSPEAIPIIDAAEAVGVRIHSATVGLGAS